MSTLISNCLPTELVQADGQATEHLLSLSCTLIAKCDEQRFWEEPLTPSIEPHVRPTSTTSVVKQSRQSRRPSNFSQPSKFVHTNDVDDFILEYRQHHTPVPVTHMSQSIAETNISTDFGPSSEDLKSLSNVRQRTTSATRRSNANPPSASSTSTTITPYTPSSDTLENTHQHRQHRDMMALGNASSFLGVQKLSLGSERKIPQPMSARVDALKKQKQQHLKQTQKQKRSISAKRYAAQGSNRHRARSSPARLSGGGGGGGVLLPSIERQIGVPSTDPSLMQQQTSLANRRSSSSLLCTQPSATWSVELSTPWRVPLLPHQQQQHHHHQHQRQQASALPDVQSTTLRGISSVAVAVGGGGRQASHGATSGHNSKKAGEKNLYRMSSTTSTTSTTTSSSATTLLSSSSSSTLLSLSSSSTWLSSSPSISSPKVRRVNTRLYKGNNRSPSSSLSPSSSSPSSSSPSSSHHKSSSHQRKSPFRVNNNNNNKNNSVPLTHAGLEATMRAIADNSLHHQ